MLPNLIVIGAARCGTTSLHHNLDLHPDVAMSKVKELDFFVAEKNWGRGLRWYETQFPSGTTVRGESSPAYSMFPTVQGVPERMARIVPQVRLVYLVRDPIGRILSSYRFARFSLREHDLELEEVVRDYEHAKVVATCRYAYQLDRYLAHFPPTQVLVVDHADLAADGAATLERVFRFAGVDSEFTTPEFGRRHNESVGLHANAAGRLVLRALDDALGNRRARAVRARVPRRVIRALLHEPEVPPEVRLDPGLRTELENYLKEDADRLRDLTGQRFETWSV